MNSEVLKENVVKLSDMQSILDNKQEYLKELQTKFNEDNKEIIEEISQLVKNIDSEKDIISNLVLDDFKTTNNKSYFGGVGVREYKKFSYDEKEILIKAKEKDMFLTLDKKAFEKVAEGLEDWGVSIDKEPKVTFPKVFKLEE